jgi:hypothetical protein
MRSRRSRIAVVASAHSGYTHAMTIAKAHTAFS